MKNADSPTPGPDPSEPVDTDAVKAFLTGFQSSLCGQLEALDGHASFEIDEWQRAEGGGGSTRILYDGGLFEQAGVAFSHVMGDAMPGSATAHRPQLAGRSWEAMGVSLVLHPHNPYVPTTHANVRFFRADKADADPVWWFGGGFDLTPFYGDIKDTQHWHRTARAACAPFGDDIYPEFKAWCDRYFYLKHRGEARGVGGLFFDDLNRLGFTQSFALMKSVAEHFYPAYAPVVQNQRNKPFGKRERDWQCYRRGRYVEFNLVYDRGTLFGLQSGGRTESILMSLPPRVHWRYNYQAAAGTPEARLSEQFLPAREWV